METFTDPLTYLVVGGAGVLIPLVVALVSKVDASPNVKSVLSVVLAGLTAGGAAVADVADIGSDWKNVVGAFLLATLGAGASLAAVWKDTLERKIGEWFPGGVGKSTADVG